MREHHHPLFERGHGPHGAEQSRERREHHHDGSRHEHGGHPHHHGGGPEQGAHGRGRHGGGFQGAGFRGEEGGFGGPRGRARRGEARHIILDALKDGPRHGYEIIKALEERSSGRYAPSPGTVYPTLQHLEDLGLMRADQDSERRVYALTDAGRADLEAHAEEVAAFWARFAAPTGSQASQAETRFLQDEIDELTRTVWSGLRGAIDVGDTETIRSVRSALERCKNEIRATLAAHDGTATREAA